MSLIVETPAVDTARRENMSTSEAATADPTNQQRGQDSLQNEPLSSDEKKPKARRLAKAKAEVARLKLELAEARLALIELESNDEDDEELTNKQSETISIVKLPAFDGNHDDWKEFRAAYYESANGLTEAENMYRLRTSLQGKAKKAVIGYTDPKYAMKTLKKHFCPDSIAEAEFERLKRLRLLSESQHELKLFATDIENVARKLLEMNCREYLYELPAMSLIGTIIQYTLPEKIRDRWYRFFDRQKSQYPNLPIFCSFIRGEAEKSPFEDEYKIF